MKFAVAVVAALLVAGCSAPPELALYREGQDAVVSPLLAEHLLLTAQAAQVDSIWTASTTRPADPSLRSQLSQAVNAVRRSETDLAVVKAAVAAYQARLETSRHPKTQPASP